MLLPIIAFLAIPFRQPSLTILLVGQSCQLEVIYILHIYVMDCGAIKPVMCYALKMLVPMDNN
jgi:hypothetical protein